MNLFIAILRGINVSGKNKLPMQDLRDLLNGLEFKDVQTYIQSGNIILSASDDKKSIAKKIRKAIQNKFDYEVPVLVKTVEEWEKAIENNPYKEVEPKQQYFTFLSDIPKEKEIEVTNIKEDMYTIIEDVVYVNAVEGYGKTKLNTNFFEKKLKVIATTRNLKTIMKLLALAKG